MSEKVDQVIIDELAPTGRLRAGINLSNFLLVSGKADNGDPVGVSPDLATEIGRRLNVPVDFVTYPSPGALADAAPKNEWDIGNIGAAPQRAKLIAFSPPYCEIAATFLVLPNSPIKVIDDVDQTGTRISTKARAAYSLWLENNLKHAQLVQSDSTEGAYELFLEENLDALAGLKPRLLEDQTRLPGARILEGQFSAVKQAVGTPRKNERAAHWLAELIEELKASGLIAELIWKHGVEGLSVAPPG